MHRELESSDGLHCMSSLSQISTLLHQFPQQAMAPVSFSLFFLSVYMKYQPKTPKKKRWWINWLCRGDILRPFDMKSCPISVEICLCKSLFLEDWLGLKITWWQKYINKLSQKEHTTLLLSQESAAQQKVEIQLQMAAFSNLNDKDISQASSRSCLLSNRRDLQAFSTTVSGWSMIQWIFNHLSY